MAMPDALDTTREFLNTHAPFDQLEPDALEFLLPRLETRFYANGERITDPDGGPAQRFHIIRQGRVRGETPSEDEQISGKAWELVPGESFPIGALLGRRPVHTVHRALEDTICLELSVEDFDRLRSRSQVFSDFCSRRLASLLERVHQGLLTRNLGDSAGSGQLNTPLGARIARDPVTCAPDAPLRDALTTMRDARVGSIVAVDADRRPVGIFTMTDLLARVALRELPLDIPLHQVMTPDPIALPDSAPGFEGIEVMAEHGMKHICVVSDGRLVGVLGERDLLTSNPLTLDRLVRGILRADAVATIAGHLREVPRLIGAVISQGAEADQILRLITRINDHATRRVLALVRQEHPIDGIEFTWLAFGSQAREEQALKTDQDNGILFRCEKGQEEATRNQLLPYAQAVNKALDECGFELCPGNIMAGNPECCLSGPEWERRFARWIDQGTPEHLLKSSIFFDLRAIDGDTGPVEALRSQLLRKTAFNSRFRRQMAANQMTFRPPLGLFGEIRSGADGINIKLQGLTPFVDGARVIALAAELPATRTHERLEQAVAAEVLRAEDARDYHAALRYLQMLRLRTQQRAFGAGREDSNRIRPEELGTLEARVLKEAFRQARKLQGQLAVQYQL
jgi:CBS domain-containing protein